MLDLHGPVLRAEGHPLFDARLPPDTAASVLTHGADGVGTRKTARLVGVHPDTVTRYIRLAGAHAEQFHDELVAFSPAMTGVQFDEKRAFVGQKEKNNGPDDPGRGDCGDHVTLDPEARLVVRLVVGKRTSEATHALVRDFRRRTGGRPMRLITSDEYPSYPDAIRAAYGATVTPPRTGRPGRPRKADTVLPSD